MLKEWIARRKLGEDHKRTNQYLEQHGQRISTLDEIVEEGDLIAVVDTFGGFYAFVTNGYATGDGNVLRDKATAIEIYDQDLNRVDSTDGEIYRVKLNLPEKNYHAKVHNRRGFLNPMGVSELTNELWVNSSNEDDPYLTTKQLSLGVYRITSEGLVSRIGVIFSDPKKEVTS